MDFVTFSFTTFQANPDKNLCLIAVTGPIVKLGDVTALQGTAELPESTFLLRNGNRINSSFTLAQFRSFCNITQTIKIHVGTTNN